MKNKHYYEVTKYFNSKAYSYDDVDMQAYWVLSDLFFKEVLKLEIPKFLKNKKKVRLLDAGAGTGRWTLFFYELFHKKYDISGTLVDVSDDMLKVSKEKISKLNISKRFECIEGNIEKMSYINNDDFDISLSFYNVLSFVEKPNVALREINKKLKKGGVHIGVVANKYHSYYFSVLTNRVSEIKAINKYSKIRFNNDMPYIYCYTPEELKKLYLKNGFSDVKIIGGLNFMYPGMEETFVHGNTKNIQDRLSDDRTMKLLLETELMNYNNGDIAGRGNVLMAIGIK